MIFPDPSSASTEQFGDKKAIGVRELVEEVKKEKVRWYCVEILPTMVLIEAAAAFAGRQRSQEIFLVL